MVRLEREGDSFVLVTGTSQIPDINILIDALSELQKACPDTEKIKEGITFLENARGLDLRKEIRKVLKNRLESFTIRDL